MSECIPTSAVTIGDPEKLASRIFANYSFMRKAQTGLSQKDKQKAEQAKANMNHLLDHYPMGKLRDIGHVALNQQIEQAVNEMRASF